MHSKDVLWDFSAFCPLWQMSKGRLESKVAFPGDPRKWQR
jgi:hypothetical protein